MVIGEVAGDYLVNRMSAKEREAQQGAGAWDLNEVSRRLAAKVAAGEISAEEGQRRLGSVAGRVGREDLQVQDVNAFVNQAQAAFARALPEGKVTVGIRVEMVDGKPQVKVGAVAAPDNGVIEVDARGWNRGIESGMGGF